MRTLEFLSYPKENYFIISLVLSIATLSILTVALPVFSGDNSQQAADIPYHSEPVSKEQPATTLGQQTTSQSTSTSVTNNGSETQVTVNGQNIPVPANGEVHETVPTQGGQTTIDISSQNNGGNTSIRSRTTTSTNSSGGVSQSTQINSNSLNINTRINTQ